MAANLLSILSNISVALPPEAAVGPLHTVPALSLLNSSGTPTGAAPKQEALHRHSGAQEWHDHRL